LTLGTSTVALAPLGPGERRQQHFGFATGTLPPGDLVATARLLEGEAVRLSCAAEAMLASAAEVGLALRGTIVAEPSVALPNQSVTLRYSVTNIGNVALAPAHLALLLVNPRTSEVMVSRTMHTTLDTGATTAATDTVGPGLVAGSYLALLQGA